MCSACTGLWVPSLLLASQAVNPSSINACGHRKTDVHNLGSQKLHNGIVGSRILTKSVYFGVDRDGGLLKMEN